MRLINCRDTSVLSSFDRAAVEAHVTLLHELAAGCEGVLILAPIWEGKPPLPQRFRVGDVAAMVGAIMAYDGVLGSTFMPRTAQCGRT